MSMWCFTTILVSLGTTWSHKLSRSEVLAADRKAQRLVPLHVRYALRNSNDLTTPHNFTRHLVARALERPSILLRRLL